MSGRSSPIFTQFLPYFYPFFTGVHKCSSAMSLPIEMKERHDLRYGPEVNSISLILLRLRETHNAFWL